MAADLITRAELRTAIGVDVTNTRDDAKYDMLIPMVSQAIRATTERDFGAPTVTEERVFEYDGSGYLDIDDASAITSVSFTYPTAPDITLNADAWAPKPERRDDAPIYWYILLPSYVGAVSGSPEMGFARNLDVYARERSYWALPDRIKVLGTWGWPVVPSDVKLAAIWTIQEWLARPSGDALTSESIEGWSRAWGGRQGQGVSLGIPSRARDLLANYARVLVE